MSYEAVNTLSDRVSLSKVKVIVELLGYVRYRKREGIPSLLAEYFWFDPADYKSFVGVELAIYRCNGAIIVTTRSRAGRSYWDLDQQNRTIRYLRDYCGGHFRSDEGSNKYMHQEGPPPSNLEAGLYLSRWSYHNGLAKPRIYLNLRNMKGSIAQPEPSGLQELDQLNPRLFSNNMLIPYLVATWEEYLRSSFVVLLKYSANRDRVLKSARLSVENLKQISAGLTSVEDAIASGMSFQRPRVIAQNFRDLDERIDLHATLKKPLRRRGVSLFDAIDVVIDQRNAFVHRGDMVTSVSDKKLWSIIHYFQTAVDRIYRRLGECYGFEPTDEF